MGNGRPNVSNKMVTIESLLSDTVREGTPKGKKMETEGVRITHRGARLTHRGSSLVHNMTQCIEPVYIL